MSEIRINTDMFSFLLCPTGSIMVVLLFFCESCDCQLCITMYHHTAGYCYYGINIIIIAIECCTLFIDYYFDYRFRFKLVTQTSLSACCAVHYREESL